MFKKGKLPFGEKKYGAFEDGRRLLIFKVPYMYSKITRFVRDSEQKLASLK